ncbi:MAG: class I SAM-dependent methyltransferase [Kiritimatiellaceae bacterium]|nr:class I SAM-dependent methyltransferase [Kiritimatiellaceae bacterium]
MGFYDTYLERLAAAPVWFKHVQQKALDRLMRSIEKSCGGQKVRDVLEIGIGSGDFSRAVQQRNWTYTGIDRNEAMTKNAGAGTAFCAEVPPFPAQLAQKKFDLIYSAFVLEHMESGKAACEFVKESAGHLADGGSLVLLVPDVLSMRMEFWSVDYTHAFPTTERNVKQIAADCGLVCQKTIRYRGWFSENRLVLAGLRLLGRLYSYRFFKSVFGHEWFFYGVYQLLNQEILMFIFRKDQQA